MEHDLARLRLRWLIGDWPALARLTVETIQDHPARRELVLLALEGNLQIGATDQAGALLETALAWDCSRSEVGRVLSDSIRTSLGFAYAAIGNDACAAQQWSACLEGVSRDGLDVAALARLRLAAPPPPPPPPALRRDPQPVFRRPDSGIVSFAQNFEDVMLWRALGRTENGFYIDVGAQDPRIDSVSRAFYERGWRGIHVEATPAYADAMKKDRPDEVVIEAAASLQPGPIEFFEIPETGISTGDPSIAASHEARGFLIRKICVPCVTLEEIFRQAGERDVHWLKIDVEGMEFDVLESWGASPVRPWIIVVESTAPLTEVETFERWEPLLTKRRYDHVYFDGLNRFYLAREREWLKPAFASGPNVFDNCTLSGLASTAFHRRAD